MSIKWQQNWVVQNKPFNLSRTFRSIRFKFTIFRFQVSRAHPNDAVICVKCQIFLIIRYRYSNDALKFLFECDALNGADTIALSQFEQLVFPGNQTACIALFRNYCPASRIQSWFCRIVNKLIGLESFPISFDRNLLGISGNWRIFGSLMLLMRKMREFEVITATPVPELDGNIFASITLVSFASWPMPNVCWYWPNML